MHTIVEMDTVMKLNDRWWQEYFDAYWRSGPKLFKNDNSDKSADEIDLIVHSPYYADGNIPKGESINTGIFNIMSLNCASINAKIDDIKLNY